MITIPIYNYICSYCNQETEELRPISARLQFARCPDCGAGELQFILAVKPKLRDLYPYVEFNMDHEPVTITSKKHREAELKKRGLREAPKKPGMKGQWI